MRSDPRQYAPPRAPEAVAVPIEVQQAAKDLADGPTGALIIAAIAVGILFVGWLAFYFFLFLPRGSIG
jgi:hypothetical protein